MIDSSEVSTLATDCATGISFRVAGNYVNKWRRVELKPPVQYHILVTLSSAFLNLDLWFSYCCHAMLASAAYPQIFRHHLTRKGLRSRE